VYRLLRRVLGIKVDVTREIAAERARLYCRERGWPWAEPVHWVLRVSRYHFITHYGYKGANIYGTVDCRTGEVVAFPPTGTHWTSDVTMESFTKQAFVAARAGEREELSTSLGEVLTARIKASGDFHTTVHRLVAELRELGHDLWSFDETDDSQTWCPNWERQSGPGIVVVFSPNAVSVEWSSEAEGARKSDMDEA